MMFVERFQRPKNEICRSKLNYSAMTVVKLGYLEGFGSSR
jgi:hypothetical protein